MEVKLIVLRTPDPQPLSEFYSLFGFTFDYHKHGASPYHYTTTIGQTILEIYPLAKNQSEPDRNLRLGFTLDHFDDTIQNLKSHKAKFITEPAQTDFGFMAVVEDLDGRKIELYRM